MNNVKYRQIVPTVQNTIQIRQIIRKISMKKMKMK